MMMHSRKKSDLGTHANDHQADIWNWVIKDVVGLLVCLPEKGDQRTKNVI